MVQRKYHLERSQVEATLTAPIVSIKNPLSGQIYVPQVSQIIMDIDEAKGQVIVGKTSCESKISTH